VTVLSISRVQGHLIMKVKHKYNKENGRL